jgi:prepilin-type N-terminal cleavage/methylation domain-containing protein/prepilin-type processing-associated H-X9-DG protein
VVAVFACKNRISAQNSGMGMGRLCESQSWESFKVVCRNPQSASLRRHGERRAFTLIELLVVMSVISLLMGIMVPVVSRVRAGASRTVCKSNLRNLALAFRMYLDENANIMPPAARMPSIEDPNDPGSKPAITEFILPYLLQPKIFECPSDRVKRYFLTEGTSYEYNSRLGGKPISRERLAERFGERNVHVMYDYEPFHGKAGKPGAKNYLYADGHVGDLTRQ